MFLRFRQPIRGMLLVGGLFAALFLNPIKRFEITHNDDGAIATLDLYKD